MKKCLTILILFLSCGLKAELVGNGNSCFRPPDATVPVLSGFTRRIYCCGRDGFLNPKPGGQSLPCGTGLQLPQDMGSQQVVTLELPTNKTPSGTNLPEICNPTPTPSPSPTRTPTPTPTRSPTPTPTRCDFLSRCSSSSDCCTSPGWGCFQNKCSPFCSPPGEDCASNLPCCSGTCSSSNKCSGSSQQDCTEGSFSSPSASGGVCACSRCVNGSFRNIGTVTNNGGCTQTCRTVCASGTCPGSGGGDDDHGSCSEGSFSSDNAIDGICACRICSNGSFRDIGSVTNEGGCTQTCRNRCSSGTCPNSTSGSTGAGGTNGSSGGDCTASGSSSSQDDHACVCTVRNCPNVQNGVFDPVPKPFVNGSFLGCSQTCNRCKTTTCVENSGSSGSSGASGTTGSGGGSCNPRGTRCGENGRSCCAGAACNSATGLCGVCVDPGESCATSSQCCSGTCRSGMCMSSGGSSGTGGTTGNPNSCAGNGLFAVVGQNCCAGLTLCSTRLCTNNPTSFCPSGSAGSGGSSGSGGNNGTNGSGGTVGVPNSCVVSGSANGQTCICVLNANNQQAAIQNPNLQNCNSLCRNQFCP